MARSACSTVTGSTAVEAQTVQGRVGSCASRMRNMQLSLKERTSLKNIWLATIVTLVISVSFWLAASWSADVNEPWDAQCYLTVLYPASLALTLVLGLLFQKRRWLAGPIVMFGQIPCVMISSEAGPLLAVGILYSILLSIPAVMLSWVACVICRRMAAGG